MEVVFGGRKMRSMSVNPGTSGYARRLSTMDATLRFWAKNFQSKCFIQSVKMSVPTYLFGCVLYWHGKDLTFLKHLGFLLFPMTSNGNFLPVALTTHILVSLTLCLQPLHFSSFNSRVLFGSVWKKRPNSSVLKISSNLYLDNMVGRGVSFQGAVISGVHHFSSPDTLCGLINAG